MRIYKNIPKRILSLCLVFAIGISMGVLSDHFVSENSCFQTFTEKLFRSEVCSNTLTLHYTLAHPEKKVSESPRQLLELHFLTRLRPPVSVRNMRKSWNPLPIPGSPKKTGLPVICFFSIFTPEPPLEKQRPGWAAGTRPGCAGTTSHSSGGIYFPDKRRYLWLSETSEYRQAIFSKHYKTGKAEIPGRAFHEWHNSGPYPETMPFFCRKSWLQLHGWYFCTETESILQSCIKQRGSEKTLYISS